MSMKNLGSYKIDILKAILIEALKKCWLRMKFQKSEHSLISRCWASLLNPPGFKKDDRKNQKSWKVDKSAAG